MDPNAVNHLRTRLDAAKRDLDGCVDAILSATDRHSWANVAQHAAQAARASAQVEAFTVALNTTGEPS